MFPRGAPELAVDFRGQLGASFGGNWPKPSCPQMLLTDAAARNAKPAAKTVRMFNRDGLYLKISPRGGKWWRLKYRYGGKEKRVSLGVYPEVNLKKARARTIVA
jgi:hypothetical protein